MMKRGGQVRSSLILMTKQGFQILAVLAYLYCMLFGGFVNLYVVSYMVLYTSWRWVTVLYLIWLWCFDRSTCHKGGRRVGWVRNMSWWKYMRDYFPINLKKATDVELDSEKNYLFCSFPHGILATGTFCAFGTNACGVDTLFPHHTCHMLTITLSFALPLNRDLGLAVGGCSASRESIDHILSRPGGGNVAVLNVGGASESFNCAANSYRIILSDRRGFVKLAIKSGAPLVPVICFGETDIYDQVPNPRGSLLRKFQETLKKWVGFAPLIPLGRAYTILPKRKPITVLVGRPIDVVKIASPTTKQVDELHKRFIEDLTTLFDEQKHLYVPNWKNVNLEVE